MYYTLIKSHLNVYQETILNGAGLTEIEGRPHGKESTEVQISQNKGKESENSHQKMKTACPTVISSFSGKSFHFPFPYFV